MKNAAQKLPFGNANPKLSTKKSQPEIAGPKIAAKKY